MTLFVLLPAYNEEDSVPALIPKIFRALAPAPYGIRVVLVDDGSTDQTARRVRALQRHFPIEVMTHPLNRGLGETIRDGIEYCVREGGPGDVVVRLDCDDSQDPEYIPSMVEKIEQDYDVVITSRYQPGGGQSGVHGYRNLLSRGAGLFMKMMFPIRGVWDYSSGYRAYRWEILNQAVNIFGNRFIEQMHLGFSCTLEKVVKLDLLGARFAEVPHVLRYDQKKSASKMASRPTTVGYLALAWKYSPWIGLRRRHWRRRITERSGKHVLADHAYAETPTTDERRASALRPAHERKAIYDDPKAVQTSGYGRSGARRNIVARTASARAD
ncbi:MAG: glycosyltransferase [Phycisphaerae bacterium]|nr:glycosyltransferase [Phycisphaerae bacterium]